MMKKRSIILTTVLAITLLISGCDNEPVMSEEDQVRATIDAIEAAAEKRSLTGMLEHISSSYKDYDGNDVKKIKGFIQLQLIQNQSINIFTKIRELEVTEDTATVELSAAMASREVDLSSDENRLRADRHRFSIVLKLEQGQWKVRSVSWQRGW